MSNLTFYMVPPGAAQCACFLLSVFGVAGQYNCMMVVSEMRIPPENLGASFVIIMTVGTLTAAISPHLSNISATFTMVYPSLLAVTVLLLTFFLIKPGLFLPKSAKLS